MFSPVHPILTQARCVIFDFDGVLVDSEPLHEEAIRRTARVRGWTMTREHFFQMVGRGDDHAFELLAREHGVKVTPAEVAAMCEAKHAECLRLIAEGRFSVQPGATELVERVAQNKPAGVCSGSRREVLRGMLDASGLTRHMKTVVTHEDVVRTKPDPEGYRLAADRLGGREAEVDRCAVIEDSPTGIRAGKAAGMTVIAVCHSFGPERLGEADLVVSRIGDLLRG
jgi:beta-phosphoglucomutase